MAGESCFGSLNCFVLLFFFPLDILLSTSWILLINNCQLEGSETRGIIVKYMFTKNRPKTIYHWLGAGLQHNVRSGGIKAVFIHFEMSENKDRR